jgi:hypothetical protein
MVCIHFSISAKTRWSVELSRVACGFGRVAVAVSDMSHSVLAIRWRTPLSQTTLTDSGPRYENPMVNVNGGTYLPRRSRT